jgi:putative thioredoxin
MNPQAADSALSYDVTEANFRQTVLERSLEVPVLLDCWAPWCGPCRNLKPVLEKLVQDYGGRFELAKLNTDEAPQISAALQIRSIPLVVLFVGGRPVDQFNGALPEGQVREFLDKHLGEQIDPVAALREDAQTADPETAESMLREGLQHVPGDMGLSGDLAERLMARDALYEAEKVLHSVDIEQQDDRHAALLKRITLARNKPAGNAAELLARIEVNKKELLEVVLRDRGEWREKARLQLVEWFDVCGDAETVSYGRRYLGMYLN